MSVRLTGMTSVDHPRSSPMELAGPQYRLIAADLRHQILAGELKVGDSIPSEQELARRHGVSRMTARHAVSQLVQQGLLRREQGRGTFVTAHKVVRGLSSVAGLREDLEREGLSSGARVISLESRPATAEETSRLELRRGRDVWHVVRSRTADGVTIALQVVVIPVDLVPDLDAMDLLQGSLYAQLRQRGLPLTSARQRIEAVTDETVCELLDVPAGTAFLRVTRLSSGPDRKPVELLVSYFVGEVYAYDVELS